MQEKLILRAVSSPYDDETKGSVLSHSELDNNFVFLKGLDIKSVEIDKNTLIIYRNNEEALKVDLTSIAGTPGPAGPKGEQGEAGAQGPVGPQGEFSATVTGGTYDINTGYITLYNNDETVVNIGGILNIISGTADSTLGTLTLTRNDGSSFTVYGFSTGATSSDSITYTNSTPSTEAVGGVAKNTTFDNDTIKSIFDRLFYKYQTPSFTTFDRTDLSTDYELGQSISIGSQTFTFTTNNTDNISGGTVTIKQLLPSTITLASGGNATVESSALTLTTSYSSNTLVSNANLYQISAVDIKNVTITKNIQANWKVKWYYGKSTNSSLTAAQITGLTNSGLVASNGTVSKSITWDASATPQFGYLAIPSICNQPLSLWESATACNGFRLSYTTLTDVPFNNPYGVNITYKIYRSTNPLTLQQLVYLCSTS